MQCVAANSAVPALIQQMSSVQKAISYYADQINKHEIATRVSLLQQIQSAIPTCEELCKKTNGYFPADSGLADPACRNCIPAGGDATAGSVNAKTCMEKYCDELALARGAGMCPNDGFMECVSANTEVPALLQQLSFVQEGIAKYTSALSGKHSSP